MASARNFDNLWGEMMEIIIRFTWRRLLLALTAVGLWQSTAQIRRDWINRLRMRLLEARAGENNWSRHFSGYYNELTGDMGQYYRYLGDTFNCAYPTDQDETASQSRVETDAPRLLELIGSQTGRMALIRLMDDLGMLRAHNLDRIARSRPEELALALQLATRFQHDIPLAAMSYPVLGSPFSRTSQEVLAAILASLTPNRLREDFHQQNFELAAEDPQLARLFADHAPAETMARVFNQGSQYFADANKRLAILRMLYQQRQVFTESPMRQAIRSLLGPSRGRYHNADVFDAFLTGIMGADPAKVADMSTEDKAVMILANL